MQNSLLTSFNGLSANVRSAIFMILAMIGFVFNDTMTKLSSANASVFQVIFIRGLLLTVIMALMVRRQKLNLNPFSTGDKYLWLRVMAEVFGAMLFLTALFNMPLANMTAIAQVVPLALTLVLAISGREQVGWRRYTAIGIGFLGVLIIVRPGTAGFNIFSILALISVAGIVIRDLATQRIDNQIPSLYVVFITTLFGTAINGAITIFTGWTTLPLPTYFALFGAALFVFVGYLFSVMTMRVGEASYTAPFRYTILVWAIILGIVVFGDIPDMWTLLGAAIVAGAGIYTLYRERRAREHDPLAPT